MKCFFHLQVNGAFQPFFLKNASLFVGCIQAAAIADVVGVAAAAAIEAGPAVHTGVLAEDIGLLKGFRNFRFGDACFYSADFIGFFTDKLMTRVKVAFWADGKIIMTGATAGQAFWQAGTTV